MSTKNVHTIEAIEIFQVYVCPLFAGIAKDSFIHPLNEIVRFKKSNESQHINYLFKTLIPFKVAILTCKIKSKNEMKSSSFF